MRTTVFKLLALALSMGILGSPVAASAKAPLAKLYVALGDSYAAGYQPGMGSTRNGYVYQVPGLALARGYSLTAVNFGCSGATTGSLISAVGCPSEGLGPGASGYSGQTQLKAATRYIATNRARIALITVSIGGNDVTACASPSAAKDCTAKASAGIRRNVTSIAKQLRVAAGPKPVIVGTTYPDVMLGAWVNPGGPIAQAMALKSAVDFKGLINPALAAGYRSGKGLLTDVTAGTGAYGSMKTMVNLAPYGLIPRPVAEVCRLSFFCDQGDIHLKTVGYAKVAALVVAHLPKR